MHLSDEPLSSALGFLEGAIRQIIAKYELFIEELNYESQYKVPSKSQSILPIHRASSRLLSFAIPQPSSLTILTSDNMISHNVSLPTEQPINIDSLSQEENEFNEVDEDNLIAIAQNTAVLGLEEGDEIIKREESTTLKLKFDTKIKILLNHGPKSCSILYPFSGKEISLRFEYYEEKMVNWPEICITESEHEFIIRGQTDISTHMSEPLQSDLELPDIVPFSPPSIEDIDYFSKKYTENKAYYFMNVLQAFSECQLQIIEEDNGDLELLNE